MVEEQIKIQDGVEEKIRPKSSFKKFSVNASRNSIAQEKTNEKEKDREN